MPERKPSRTALLAAAFRAAHQVFDEEPHILEDPIAMRLLDAYIVERVLSQREHFQTPRAKALRAHLVLRSRYAEDRLKEAVLRGTRQYAILGAGFDTFAYRQPGWAQTLQIYEVDQPASQSVKRQRLLRGKIAIPPNVRFLSVDFGREILREALDRGGVDFRKPVFFSWLGVMMYLAWEAVDEVFAVVASLPKSSEIVFTFARPESGQGRAGTSLANRAASAGEPWLTLVGPEELARRLRAFGFSEVRLLSAEESAGTYFRGRGDGLRPPPGVSIGTALV